ncbi:hypothetical protein HPB50_005233 [Hyalomma asiaticum]|uniref:Uncharacterized protein n=1 Tax=Hyalomma asiaticum TaxID=266040 RepID=A0ACB7SMU7_HYAAI|nr:hypothetical protein HPB50_005233 [Hyalomma asiaticum]
MVSGELHASRVGRAVRTSIGSDGGMWRPLGVVATVDIRPVCGLCREHLLHKAVAALAASGRPSRGGPDALHLVELLERASCTSSTPGGSLTSVEHDEAALWWAAVLRVALLWVRGEPAQQECAQAEAALRNLHWDQTQLFVSDASRLCELTRVHASSAWCYIMSASTKKRKILTLEDKMAILGAVSAGEKRKDVAAKFGIPASSLSTILNAKDAIRSSVQHGTDSKKKKKLKSSTYAGVDKAVFTWFMDMRARNVPISSALLQQKARDYACILGCDDLKGSNGWLEGFKRRHGIVCKVISGESSSADSDGADSRDQKDGMLAEAASILGALGHRRALHQCQRLMVAPTVASAAC